MKVVTVDMLKEDDILAKDVLLEDYTVLLSKGTKIKEAYIEKLKELEIYTVYIDDEIPEQVETEEKLEEKEEEKKSEEKPKKSRNIPLEEITILRHDVEDLVKNKVKDLLELHVYQHTEGLEEISEAAVNIINDIMTTDEVVERVYDIKERGADVYEHSISTCTIATLVALKMKFEENDIYDISVSSLLHDLGLRYLVVKYENQDINFLPANEQEEYKKHPIYGYTAIKNENWISNDAKEIILNHHEHKNGSGFPLGSEKMTRKCQVLSVCDEFDELICGIGKARVRVHEAINMLRNYSGIWYDDDIVYAFLGLIAVYPAGSKVITNEGEKAIVMKQNAHFPERPIIKIYEDKYGQTVMEEKIIDLIKETKVVIQDVIK